MTVAVLGSSELQAETGIDNIKIVEQLCKEQSEAMLEELDLAPSNWRAQKHNDDVSFNIEGFWSTRNGSYLVECSLPFKASENELELNLYQTE